MFLCCKQKKLIPALLEYVSFLWYPQHTSSIYDPPPYQKQKASEEISDNLTLFILQ